MATLRSIIVVTYNSAQHIGACLASILVQRGADDEVVVVDNGSTDATAALVASYPEVKLILSDNTGYAGGNNRGAQAAQGAVLVFLNPDTVLFPGALAALTAPLFTPSDVALTTACVVLQSDPQIVNTCGNTMHYTGLAYCRGAGQPVSAWQQPGEVDSVSGAACAIRRPVFEALGGFDERFFLYVEDTDLSLRARLAGYRCWYVPTAVVAHDYRLSYTPTKAWFLDRNRHLMLLSNLPWPTYLALVPGLLLGEIVTWGFLLLRGPRFWPVKGRVYRALWQSRATMHTARGRPRPARQLLAAHTYRLDFAQLANKHLARLAQAVFDPAFWLARCVLGLGRATF